MTNCLVINIFEKESETNKQLIFIKTIFEFRF